MTVLQIVANAAFSLLAAWMAVQWSLKRFRSEKWWELQSGAYKQLLEGLAVIKHYVEETLNQRLNPADMVGPNQTLVDQVPQAIGDVQKAAATGPLYISASASDAVNEFVKAWRIDLGVERDELERLLKAVKECLTTVRSEASGLSATARTGGNMQSWRALILRGAGAGLGIGIVVCAAVGLSTWYKSRSKPWNAHAVTAEYDYIRPEDDNKSLRFYFVLQNNTDRDYRADSATGIEVAAKLRDVKAFSGFADHYISEDFPIFVPAKGRVRVSLKIPYPYPEKEGDGATAEERRQYSAGVERYITEKWSNLGGFVLFDSSERYEIEFPSGWEQRAREAPGKK
jgi:hypothetical protein